MFLKKKVFLPMSSCDAFTPNNTSDDEFTTIDGVGKAKLENMEMPL
jgi:hypothetical protein